MQVILNILILGALKGEVFPESFKDWSFNFTFSKLISYLYHVTGTSKRSQRAKEKPDKYSNT